MMETREIMLALTVPDGISDAEVAERCAYVNWCLTDEWPGCSMRPLHPGERFTEEERTLIGCVTNAAKSFAMQVDSVHIREQATALRRMAGEVQDG